MSAECDALSERNNEQQARVTVLTQQQLRLTKDLRELKTNLKVAHSLHADYQKDMSKLNSLISQNHDAETELQAQNFVIEMDCLEELKTAEKDCISLQASINEVRNAKEKLLDEMVEMERQALLWEKKIQLDKETKAALDPTIGAAENESMEKEIHRMELRLEALKREQEKLAVEMENAILKRSTIATRYNTSSAAAASKSSTSNALTLSSSVNTSGGKSAMKEMTMATAKKKIGVLKKDARLLAEETSQVNALFEQKKEEVRQIAAQLEATTNDYGEAEEQCHRLQGNINDLLYQKQLQQERIGYRQKYIARLRELSSGAPIDLGQTMQIERKLVASTQALDNVREIISELQMGFPHLQEVLQRVAAMTDPAIDLSAEQ